MTREVRRALAGATAWSALLIPAAFFWPVEGSPRISYGSGATTVWPLVSLVRVNGTGVLGLVAIPFVLSLAVWGLLSLSSRDEASLALLAAWTISIVVLAAALLGAVTFLIGAYVAPTGVLLVLACLTRRREMVAGRSLSAAPDVEWAAVGACGHRNDVGATFCTTCGRRL